MHYIIRCFIRDSIVHCLPALPPALLGANIGEQHWISYAMEGRGVLPGYSNYTTDLMFVNGKIVTLDSAFSHPAGDRCWTGVW